MKVSAAGVVAGAGVAVLERRAVIPSALALGGVTASHASTKIINQPVERRRLNPVARTEASRARLIIESKVLLKFVIFILQSSPAYPENAVQTAMRLKSVLIIPGSFTCLIGPGVRQPVVRPV
jgi:hypothetical protein